MPSVINKATHDNLLHCEVHQLTLATSPPSSNAIIVVIHNHLPVVVGVGPSVKEAL